MFRLIITCCLLLLYGVAVAQRKTIVAVFAHSDDETAIGPVLAKYAADHKVYVIYAIDVADSSRIPGMPVGDAMKKLRREEAICACSIFGIQPPIFLGFGRLDGRNGPREYFLRTKALKPVLQQKIDSLRPDAIITFGPDGESGHFEHRVVSGIVTELLLYNGWVDKYPLFYLARDKQAIPADQLEGTGEVDRKYLNTQIAFTDEHESVTFRALRCYKSQFRSGEIDDWQREEAANTANIFFFRQFTVPTTPKTSLF